MRRLTVLWLSHFVPYPPKGGAFQRSYNLLRAVGARHELHLIALQHKSGAHPEDERALAATELGRFCRSVEIVDGTAASRGAGLLPRVARMVIGTPLSVSVSNVAAMRRAIRQQLSKRRFDLVHFDTIGLACYANEIGRMPAVLSHHGAESFMMLRRIRLEKNVVRKLVFLADGRLLRRYEARHLPRFGENLVVSELDRRLLGEIAPTARFSVVPNGVDTAYFHAMPPVASRKIVFAGRLDQYSNRDAILHFVRSAWPGIRSRFPDATLDILGMNPPQELQKFAATDPAIRIHGFVPDVRPFFEQAALGICPIRDGGGTRIKILDNLAMGKPIVSTTIGIEGIDVEPGRDLLIADTPTDFVEQVSRIFSDAGLRQALAARARQVAEERYSWDGIGARMLEAFERVAAVGGNEPGHA